MSAIPKEQWDFDYDFDGDGYVGGPTCPVCGEAAIWESQYENPYATKEQIAKLGPELECEECGAHS